MPYAIDVCHINVMMCVLRNVADYTAKPAKIIVTSTTVNVQLYKVMYIAWLKTDKRERVSEPALCNSIG